MTRSLVLAVVAIGCTPSRFDETGGDGATSSTSGGPGPSGTPITSAGTGPSSSEDSTTTGAGSSSSTGEDVDVRPGFITPSDLYDSVPCSTFTQDCPAGERCAWWDGPPGLETRCVPLTRDPDGLGEPCTVSENWSEDSCDVGLICWYMDWEAGTGVCAPFCTGDVNEPICEHPDTLCRISGSGLAVCAARCNPLEPECPASGPCIALDAEGFACSFDASGDLGAYGDLCGIPEQCDPGLGCALAEDVPGCAERRCCTRYCDLDAPSCPAAEQDCIPVYEPTAAPSGYEDVGKCAVP